MPADRPTRRRALAIFAATAAGCLADLAGPRRAVAYEWQGLAMGAQARIVFGGIERDFAQMLVPLVSAEIERLEGCLSLFREDSEISRLNKAGYLRYPGGDLRAALALALSVSRASAGLFDPTVQVLWEAYTDWFAAGPHRLELPEERLAPSRRLVDWRRVALSAAAISLGENQRITLNGLGQGYVTDRVAELLRRHGLHHVLIDLGEQRALGPQSDGSAWRIARNDAAPIALTEGALATSEASGCVFGAAGAAHHLFDPRSGRSANLWRRVTVLHPSAAVADALSTALYAATEPEISVTLGHFPEAAAFVTDRNGRERQWVPPATAAPGLPLPSS